VLLVVCCSWLQILISEDLDFEGIEDLDFEGIVEGKVVN
jgi:hypothetical protein